MSVSLNQAIRIHAKVLKRRNGQRAARIACERAHHFLKQGDVEGHRVWIAVAEVTKALLSAEAGGGHPKEPH